MGSCFSTEGNKASSNREGVSEKNPNEADIVVGSNTSSKSKEVNATDLNPNASAAHETIPFPKNGIKLSYLLNDFVKECGGKEALEGLTTTDVCNQFVMPATKEYELSYSDMILEKAKAGSNFDGVVKTATVFISHAWKYKFLDVLSALEDHFKDEPDKIVWFDLVSNNQHKATELPYEWWATTFKDAIEQLGHTVMVMAPWNDPIPYKRAWCIFEAYCTSVTGATFEIAMSNNEHRAFIEECMSGPTDVINKMLSIVNAEKSEAWNPSDKERIHSVIRNEVGFAEINSMVFEQLRDWVLVVALKELERVEIDTKDEADLMYLVGTLFKDQGRHDEAEPLFKECLAKREKIQGPDHPDTLASMSNLAGLYKNQSKYDEAEPLYKECIAKYEAILGSEYPGILPSMNNLAALYEGQGRYDEAEPLMKQCLAKCVTIKGLDHPHTLISMNNLANLYMSQGKYGDAEPLFKECLAKHETILGPDHPDTLTSMNNLAFLYCKQGKYDEAEPIFKECLAKCEMMLGFNHPETLKSLNNLGALYSSQGKYDEAEPLYKECLANREEIQGQDHPDTLESIHNLAYLYTNQRKFDEAESLYMECLAKQKTILGSDHPSTLHSMNNLAELYHSQGKYDEAEPLYKECIAKRETILGPDHPQTSISMNNLVELYKSQGNMMRQNH